MPSLDGDDQLAVVMADAHSFPIEGFVEESDVVLSGLPLAGGLAIGGQGPGSTRLLIDGRVVDRGAVGVVIGGGVEVSTFVSQGCRPVGNPMTITKCEGNVLLELAGRPALMRLEDLLLSLSPEDQAIATTGLTMGVARDEYRDEMGQGDFLVRNVIRVDAERRAIVVADVFEVGQTVQFQLRDAAAATSDLNDVIARWRSATRSTTPAVPCCSPATVEVNDSSPLPTTTHWQSVTDLAGRRSQATSRLARSDPSPAATTCTVSRRRS